MELDGGVLQRLREAVRQPLAAQLADWTGLDCCCCWTAGTTVGVRSQTLGSERQGGRCEKMSVMEN